MKTMKILYKYSKKNRKQSCSKNLKLLEGTMLLLWTKIGEKPFMKERVWKTYTIKTDQEITGKTTKNKVTFVQI